MAKVENQELLEFLMGEMGGQEAVMMKFYAGRLADMASSDSTVDELLDEAKGGGWLDWLKGLKVIELANIVNPPAKGSSGGGKRGKRMTAEEKEALYESVLEFLGQNPWSSKNEVAEGVGFDAKKLGPHLKILRDGRKLKTSGEKAGMTYAVVGDKTKPPA